MRMKQRKSSPIATCCVCGRVRTGCTWSHDPSLPDVNRTHTYCPRCAAIEMQAILPAHGGFAFGD